MANDASLQIVIQGELPSPTIELNQSAYNMRDIALAGANDITTVNDAVSLDLAGDSLKTITALIKTVEENRKEVKAPVLDVGRQIDSLAKEYISSLESERKRISSLIGAYQEELRLRAQREREEAERIQQEALEKMRAEQAKAEEANDEEAYQEAINAAAEQIAKSQIRLAESEGPKTDGIASRKSWKFEVVDINLLHSSRPDLCIVSPNNTAIRSIISATKGASIPGIRIWQEASAIVRTAKKINPQAYDY